MVKLIHQTEKMRLRLYPLAQEMFLQNFIDLINLVIEQKTAMALAYQL